MRLTKLMEKGKKYLTQEGKIVTVVRVFQETVECDDLVPAGSDELGSWEEHWVHRYNRLGDLGRVTGTAHDFSCPQNVICEYRESVIVQNLSNLHLLW